MFEDTDMKFQQFHFPPNGYELSAKKTATIC